MVFHGPSRGCRTCNHRRKKCDQARPSCMRCVNSGRTCGGYKEPLGFVHWDQKPQPNKELSLLPHFKSKAQKCTLPVRISSDPGSTIGDEPPKEQSSEAIEEFVLCAFLYEYCASPINQEISRGYLHGLEPMLNTQSPRSALGRACRAIALANHSIALNRPSLMTRAEEYYQGLLKEMTQRVADVSHNAMPSSRSVTVTAILLGLYEMVHSDDASRGNHYLHACGAAALLHTRPSLCGLLRSMVRLSPFTSATYSIQGALHLPGIKSQHQPLDPFIIEARSLWDQTQDELSNITPCDELQIQRLRSLEMKIQTLDNQLRLWASSRAPQCRPQILREQSNINHSDHGTIFDLAKWPGRIDSYCDIYIAAVWNMFRTTRLQLLSLSGELSRALGNGNSHANHSQTSQLLDELISSIPYHLSSNVDTIIRGSPTTGKLSPPSTNFEKGRVVGALLLMHPLFIVSQLPIATPETQHFIRSCLAWIGEQMGVGHAAVLSRAWCRLYPRSNSEGNSNVSDEERGNEVPVSYVDSALFLIWVGVFV